MPRLSFALVAVVLSLPSVAIAAEVRLPGEGLSIQEAIDFAKDGDVIVVPPGVYPEALDFLGKRITVRSEAGPFETTIDATGFGRTAVVIDTTAGAEDGGESDPRLEGFRIRGADSGAFGGGVRLVGPGAPVVSHCIIENNAANFGGGLFIDEGSNARIHNTIIFGNSATGFGAAVFSDQSHPLFSNCTITGNGGNPRGGVLFSVASQVEVTNSIIWNNTPYEILGVNPIIRYSAVEGGWSGAANINEDPQFRNPALGDYRPAMLSPCVDAGNDDDVPFGVDLDIRGHDRFVGAFGGDAAVDMGAIEYQGVEPGDPLPPVVEAAPPGMTIIVQPGVYEGPIDFGGKPLLIKSTGGPESASIVPPKEGEPGPLVRCTSAEGVNSILDGFTIEGGRADFGAGMLIDGANPTIINCIFRDNVALAGQGGAMAIIDGAPDIVNCVFLDNRATFPGDGEGVFGGGAIFNESAAPRITNCTFLDNIADVGNGGAIASDGASTPFVVNSILWFNTFDQISGPVGLVSYSNVEGGFPGPANIDEDPRIVNEFDLDVFSPCIDAGDTTAFSSNQSLDILGQSRFFDDFETEDTGKGYPPIDMGAFEFQGAPPPPSCDEDVDGDQQVGFSDILAVLASWGPCDGCVEDIDRDGEVGFGDILRILAQFGLCPQALGACCTYEGCLELNEEACYQMDGEFLGFGTECDRDGIIGGFCGLGACCVYDGTCVDGVSEYDCFNMKGDYRGDGTDCEQEQCEP